MSNVLYFSDAHLHPHKKSINRLNDCLTAFEWVFQTAVDKNIKHIVFAGDMFQDRQKIDILTYDRTYTILDKYCSSGELKLWILVGNHDMWFYDKWDYHTVKPFGAIKGITVIDKPCTLEIDGHLIDFLPYTHKPLDYLKELREGLKNRVGRKVLVSHLSVDGAKLNTLHNTHADVSIEHDGDMVKVGPDVFAGWDQVWLGHYHAHQIVKTDLDVIVEYIGSPLQLNFGEAFQHKYIISYDIVSGEKEYIKNTFSPQHFIIPEKDIDKYDIKNNFIRIEIEDMGKAGLLEVKNDLKQLLPGSIEIVPAQKESEEHIIEDAKAIFEKEDEMLQEYVNQVNPETLDKTKLIDMGKKICERSVMPT